MVNKRDRLITRDETTANIKEIEKVLPPEYTNLLVIVDDLPHVWGKYQNQVINILPFFYYRISTHIQEASDDIVILEDDQSHLNPQTDTPAGYNGHVYDSLASIPRQGFKLEDLTEEDIIELNSKKPTDIISVEETLKQIKAVEDQKEITVIKCINKNDCFLHYLPLVLQTINELFFKLDSNCLKRVLLKDAQGVEQTPAHT